MSKSLSEQVLGNMSDIKVNKPCIKNESNKRYLYKLEDEDKFKNIPEVFESEDNEYITLENYNVYVEFIPHNPNEVTSRDKSSFDSFIKRKLDGKPINNI